jgi:ATP-binding cassette subfamily F protein 3
LIQALQQYEGTVIVVSHDRYFLDNIANKIWFIENKKIKEYPGTYQEYEEWNAKRIVKPIEQEVKKASKKEEPKKEKVVPNDDNRKILQRKNRELSELETRIADKENQVKEQESQLAKEEIFSDSVKLQEATRLYNSTKAEYEQLQKQWEELAEEIMMLEG